MKLGFCRGTHRLDWHALLARPIGNKGDQIAMKFISALVALPITLAVFVTAPASAQRESVPGFDASLCEGQISTFPLEAVPDDEFYWVDIFDRTDEALAFRETFLKTLRSDSYKTNKDARLVFSFESQSAFLGLSGRNGIDQARGAAERKRDPGENVGVSELRDTIRDSGSERRGRTSLGQKLDAKAELRDMKTGKVIWLATLSCTPLTGDRSLLARFVSRVIVDSLGGEGGKTTF